MIGSRVGSFVAARGEPAGSPAEAASRAGIPLAVFGQLAAAAGVREQPLVYADDVAAIGLMKTALDGGLAVDVLAQMLRVFADATTKIADGASSLHPVISGPACWAMPGMGWRLAAIRACCRQRARAPRFCCSRCPMISTGRTGFTSICARDLESEIRRPAGIGALVLTQQPVIEAGWRRHIPADPDGSGFCVLQLPASHRAG
jgi:hypothetical protein